MTGNEKLKRCPFCGCSAKVRKEIQPFVRFYASCNVCGIKTLSCDTEEQAVKKWNRRI